MTVFKHYFAVLYETEAVGNVDMPHFGAFDLRPRKGDARLCGFLDEIIETRFFIEGYFLYSHFYLSLKRKPFYPIFI